MLKEWTDDLTPRDAARVWHEMGRTRLVAELRRLEAELKVAVSQQTVSASSFFSAMRNFMLLRDRLFPDLPGEPAFRLLMTLAEAPPGRGQASVTGIAYGAGVPITTAVRYIAIMEAQGIVERRPDPRDGRRYLIELTAEGRRRVDELADHWALKMLVVLAIPAAVLVCALLK
jgi:DNA-binding MarR family transcriptional regulator